MSKKKLREKEFLVVIFFFSFTAAADRNEFKAQIDRWAIFEGKTTKNLLNGN